MERFGFVGLPNAGKSSLYNALAGGGISVVTLCYLRRYLAFLADLEPDVPSRRGRVIHGVGDDVAEDAVETALAESPLPTG